MDDGAAEDSIMIEEDVGALEILEEGQLDDNMLHENVKGTSKQMKMARTNDDVQRAIEGLKDIPDEELQEFLDDEDFMQGLDVVDAWEGEEEKGREGEQHKSRAKDRERRRSSRDRHRRDHRNSHNRDRPRRDDRKREEIRRDPSKSTKDIEKDKIRTKKDSESKILAEKEKAIKYLLDSDNVVPPGTEAEAIQTIAELGQKATPRVRRSRERRRSHKPSPIRRRSNDRIRLSPHRRRSPLLMTPEHRRSPFKISSEKHRSPVRLSSERRRSLLKTDHRRSPVVLSPERRRSPFRLSPDRPRRPSWERRISAERWGIERHRRRIEAHERDPKLSGRRSRSHDRYRSRSIERHRRRYSRSPVNKRFSPRRRSRSRSRSPDRRTRKRSPFINEITRQFRNEGMMPSVPMNSGYMGQPPMGGVPPLMGMGMYEQESGPPPPPPPSSYMHQPGQPGPPGMQMPGGPPSFMNFEQHLPPVPMMNFEPLPLQPLPPPQPDYSSGPVMYNQPNSGPVAPANPTPLLPLPVPSPQPVPAPGSSDQVPVMYNQMHRIPLVQPASNQQPSDSVNKRSITPHSYKDRRSTTPYKGLQTSSRKDRLKTPEPPVISDSKLFEKTSLSSLLEASVSAKDSTGLPVLYPGFKPEILQHCEHALRDLPIEDPRLKMKGRFFFDANKDEPPGDQDEHSSNSILLRKGRSKIYWDEEEEQHLPSAKARLQMHQKICQTDEIETDTKFTQTSVVTMVDFCVQVCPYDIQQPVKEEKRPIMDRLDWNMRETFDYTPKIREADDLRWSLSNSSQKRSWSRTMSPSRGHDDRGSIGDPSMDHGSRNLESPVRSRDNYSSHRSSDRDHFMRESYSSSYRRAIEEHDDYHENRSEHSRGESPMVLEDSGEEIEVEQDDFSRGSDWHGRGKSMRGKTISLYKMHGTPRGKHPASRPYRGGRGGFRGKF